MARVIGIALPLSARKALVACGICRSLPGGFEFSMGILDDLRQRDPDTLHRFLWSNHLAYAASYEIPKRFGASNLNPSRRILFAEMETYLNSLGVEPHLDVASAFEVGCSMGYLLRHLEVEVCPSAEILHGLDIDAYAVDAGAAHLRSLQSKVRLHTADLAATEQIMGKQIYDLVLCCGVLMYVNENTAEELVRTMLSHAGFLVGVICLAHPRGKHSALERSETRLPDGAFIHNVHRMIRRAGGRVVSSNHIESSISGSSPSHAILAEPPRSAGRIDRKQRLKAPSTHRPLQ
jgi:SAM-dependent methyltransferase